MAVKTQIDMERMRALIAGRLEGKLEKMEPVAHGNTQTNYVLHVGGEKYIFRLYESRPERAVAFEMETLSLLGKKDFPCPQPVGEPGEIDGKAFAVFRFIEGEHAQEWNEARRCSAARTAARLALCTQGFRPQNTPFRMNYGKEFCAEYARKMARKTGKTQKLAWYLGVLAQIDLPETLSMGVCHADWDISNMFFAGDEVSALLDFDDANYTYLAYDLAAMLDPVQPDFRWDTWHLFAPDAQVIDLKTARMLSQAYCGVRAMRQDEKEHLFDMVKLSVMIDCLWFFARGEGDFFEKRKIDALDRIGREAFTQALFE